MNSAALNLVWRSDVRRPVDLLVLLALAGLADASGWLSASVAEIAQHSRLSARSVRRALCRLEAEGWVLRGISAGAKGVNVYCLPALVGRAAA